MQRHAVGIDIGGSFIKGSIVDLERGRLVGEKLVVPSPAMSTVAEMMDAMAQAAPEDASDLATGITFPGVIRGGVVHTAANVAKAWIGRSLPALAAERLKRPIVAINDADAAGLAELHFGAAREVLGTVLASGRRGSATCSAMPSRRPRASSSSTNSTPSANRAAGRRSAGTTSASRR